MGVKWSTISIFCLMVLSSAVSAQNEDEPRGQLLYENHCLKCHDVTVHTRKDRKVKNIIDLNQWVIRWQYDQKLNWNLESVNEVTRYLNNSFYHFPATP